MRGRKSCYNCRNTDYDIKLTTYDCNGKSVTRYLCRNCRDIFDIEEDVSNDYQFTTITSEILRKARYEISRKTKTRISRKTKARCEISRKKRYESVNTGISAGITNRAGIFAGITHDELLEFLLKFEREKGRPPTSRDLVYNPNYPGADKYVEKFGSLEKAKKLIGQDTESMVRRGIVRTTLQKARLAEVFVFDHFVEKGAIDMSGDNCTSPIDGICPKGQIYDVKSSKLHNGKFYQFTIDKGNRVDFYYLLAFNEDYSELMYAWRIPWNLIEGWSLYIGFNNISEYNIENMKEYEITNKFNKRKIFEYI